MTGATVVGTVALDLPAMSAPRKRSVVIAGHATSVTLEDAFWAGLRAIAAAQGMTASQVIALIDQARPTDVGLATAIRLTVLAAAQGEAVGDAAGEVGDGPGGAVRGDAGADDAPA